MVFCRYEPYIGRMIFEVMGVDAFFNTFGVDGEVIDYDSDEIMGHEKIST